MKNPPWNQKRQAEITARVDYLLSAILHPDCLRKTIFSLFESLNAKGLYDGSESSAGQILNLEELQKLVMEPDINTRDLLAIKQFLESFLNMT